MALSDEMSKKVLDLILGGATITTAGICHAGLMHTGGVTNLTTSADFVTNYEMLVANYTGYTRTVSSLTTGFFGAYVPGTFSGSRQNSLAAIVWPPKADGTATPVNGVFLINSASGAGDPMRWTTTFATVQVSALQTPRIPINGCIITER